MKRKEILFLVIIIIGFTTHINAQIDQGFTIKGQFKGLPNMTKIYLTTQEKDTVARTISTGNHFVFRGKLPLNGRFHFIHFDTLVSKVGTKSIFVVNGSMNVSGAVGQSDIIVAGSTPHQDNIDLANEMLKFDRRQVEMGGVLTAMVERANAAYKAGDSISGKTLTQQQDDYFKKIDILGHEKLKAIQDWLKAHSNSLYTPFVASSLPNIKDMQQMYDILSPEVKASYYGVELKNIIDNSRLSVKISEGKIIPNFDLKGVSGELVRIHTLVAKNKLTLIDFWASWCKPCRAETPGLKKIYNKFKDKGFGIVGASVDKSETDWKNAVKQDGTEWFHGIDKSQANIQLFDMKAIPAYILIDNKGKLIAFDCAMSSIPNFGGSLVGETLEKKIEALLNERGK